MDEQLEQYEGAGVHPVYFAINTKSRGSWGHQQKILGKLFNLKLEIIDFRSWHAPEYNHSHDTPLTKESFYVQDMMLALSPTKHLDEENKKDLLQRVKQIRMALKHALGEQAVISIKRWLPGVQKKDDELAPEDAYIQQMFGLPVQYKPQNRKSVEYCRQEAFKQAHSLMSLFERKATIDDLKRQSSRRLMAEKTASNGDRDEKWDHELSFSDEKGKHKKEKKSGEGSGSGTGSGSGSGEEEERNLGGAAALPVTDGTINIVRNHFDEEESEKDAEHIGHQRNDSHMSYIYGDEDALMHQLPEYSIEQHEYGMDVFNPSLPQLDEDAQDEVAVEDLNLMQMAGKGKLKKPKEVLGGGTDTDDNETETELDENDNDVEEKVPTQLKKKLTIKIYPPSMKPLGSASPVSTQSPVGSETSTKVNFPETE